MPQGEQIPLLSTVGFMWCSERPTVASPIVMPDFSSAASRLCASCGMCCNGVMFHFVKLQPGDSPRALAALGLKVKRKRKQDCILQPCPAHTECKCMIYEARPVRCRVFECQQLHRVAACAITEAAACEKISEAKLLVSEIDALLLRLGATNLRLPLSKRCESVAAETHDPSSDEATTQARIRLVCAMHELEGLLDQHFRIEPAESGS